MKKILMGTVAALIATPAMAEVIELEHGSAMYDLLLPQAQSDCLFAGYHIAEVNSVDLDAEMINGTCSNGDISAPFQFTINNSPVINQLNALQEFYADQAELAAAEAAINAGLPLDESGEALDMEEVNERVELLEAALDALGKSEDLELGDYPIANQDPDYPHRSGYPHLNAWQWANYVYGPWFRSYFYPEVVRPWFDQRDHILNISYIVGDMLDDDFDAMIQEMFNAADNNNGKSEDNNRGNDFSDNSDVVKVDRQERSDLTDISDGSNETDAAVANRAAQAAQMLAEAAAANKATLEEWIDTNHPDETYVFVEAVDSSTLVYDITNEGGFTTRYTFSVDSDDVTLINQESV